ncbi:MAG TPA: nitrate reductase associated protein [Cyanobacteria bacterium UBA11149]|nr:nitrate reductase associated protein [Cyanobacteria bacterium UBA11367]HBE60284.1 nitrate reductase associated protein [Cyanobacteria bacterium UBA11366]HBK62554.1 nitrate reductase associated protein [Cyanobacteria bacterium UBA11166]HBR77068.1 nitrate reductase associated protein [Cyanobacteria bacterium UBA11159]HBS71413.1 nitrate reductase associated protein [Cyanobacteria bacterium UBA11153]HBW89402.1 nitrate reductase associated protein [Cyanobacteria bacterium UBA11149]HCA93524.1 ni
MTFFQFEADFVDSLRCIPMQVRYKLDTCGVKLKLPDWNHFSQLERQELVQCPCETETEGQTYREMVHQLVAKHGGDPPKDLPIDPTPEWHNPGAIPASVEAQSFSLDLTLTIEQWASLTPLQRFALIKLSRSNHENRNFLPALKEFDLA